VGTLTTENYQWDGIKAENCQDQLAGKATDQTRMPVLNCIN